MNINVKKRGHKSKTRNVGYKMRGFKYKCGGGVGKRPKLGNMKNIRTDVREKAKIPLISMKQRQRQRQTNGEKFMYSFGCQQLRKNIILFCCVNFSKR